MASRTLLVNPKEDQKQAYMLAEEAFAVIINNLKIGQPISNAYVEGRNFIKEKNPAFVNKIHSNFGFGVKINHLIL